MPGHVRVITIPGEKYLEIACIVYCIADIDYTWIYMNDGTSHYASGTLKKIEKEIGCSGFFRIHKSRLVNLDYFMEYQEEERTVVVLCHGTPVPLGVSELKEYWFIDKLSELGLL